MRELTDELRAYAEWAREAGIAIPVVAAAGLAQSGARVAGLRALDSGETTRAAAASAGDREIAATLNAPESAARSPERSASRPEPERPAVKLKTLQEIVGDIGDCTRCKLHKGRHNIVFGVGDPKARLMFVGEAPGEDEDLKGEPFVGRAGQLLTKMIEAMGLRREDVYICNTVKCRPPNNRNPEPDELTSCEPFLKAQLASVKPEVIVTLGKFAAQALLREDTPISRLRGSFREYAGVPLMPTFHPAYLLRSPGEKGKVWDDLKQVMNKLGLKPPTKVTP